MRELTRSGLAEQDLFEIWRTGYMRWSETQADRYLDQLEAGMRRVLDHPEIGRTRDEVRDGYRSLLINQHVVFYQLLEAEVHIVRVLLGSADLKSQFDL